MSKLSVHLTDPGNRRGYGDFLRIPAEAGNPVKIVYQCNANTKADVLAYSPTTDLVHRRQTDTWNRLPGDMWQGDPRRSCENWMLNTLEQGKNLVEWWLMNPAEYYDPLNEPVPQTIDQAKWMNDWMIRALEIAHEHGLKLALFSFPVGRPDYELWEYLYPALRLGKQYGAILSLHQYGVEYPLIVREANGALSNYTLHTTLRHRKIYEIMPVDCQLPLVISECGCGNGYAVPLKGQPYINDAIEYDREIMKDSYVLGANLFQLGGEESNLQEVLATLTMYIAKTPTPVVTPPTPPNPVEDEMLPYVVTAHLAPQNATLNEMDQVQSKAFDNKSTVCQSADDARFLVKSGQPGSKVIIYDPERWTDDIIAYFAGCTVEIDHLSKPPLTLVSPILTIPYKITDHFNAPRTYANGKHEGLDLDCFDDASGLSVNIYAAQNGVVEDVITQWSGMGYGVHVIIRHDQFDVLYKTWYCHLGSASVAVGQSVKVGDKIGQGGATGTNAIHLHFMVQKIPGGLDGYFTPSVIDPEPLITVPPLPPVIKLPAKRGVGAGRRATLSAREIDAFKVGKANAFMALSMPSATESMTIVSQIMAANPQALVIGRLFFSADSTNKTLFNPQDFVAYCRNGLDGLYAKGVRYFQIHNEPNLVNEGMDWNWKNGIQFGNWLIGVLDILRPLYPEARWGYPGLSPQPNTEQFWTDSQVAMNKCDWVGVHAYWQTRGDTGWGMESLDGGYHYKRLKTNLPIMITEFSNNSPTVALAEKGAQYKDYYTLVDIPAFCFCLSWDGDTNKEGWVQNGQITAIPETLGK